MDQIDNNQSNHHDSTDKNNTRSNDTKQSSLITVMQRTRNKFRARSMSILSRCGGGGGKSASGGLIDYEKGSSKLSSTERVEGNKNNWSGSEYSASENAVGTLDLFRYAESRELVAIIIGIMFMIYAASWQPISVFILAIMASLMGRYSKQAELLKNLNKTSAPILDEHKAGLADVAHSVASSGVMDHQVQLSGASLDSLTRAFINQTSVWLSGGSDQSPTAGSPIEPSSPIDLIDHSGLALSVNPLDSHSHSQQQQQNDSSLLASYDEFSFLEPLHSFVAPIFDLGSSNSQHYANQTVLDDSLKAAVHVILERESAQFLRKSFEINGSAFALALTQLFAFFLGLTLITWAAKKQASRIKLLYFSSCLHQEVTWFEAIDSASGSGSSLNGLVEKYEDGIGMKLALLCYFLGHIGLFTLTAFYQMFSLAAFCMPFVLLIGIIIAHLSDWQAGSIGEQALFAKRSLQLAEEIIAAIRTVFAFNGQQKEITRYSLSLEPVYRKSLIKHLYTALNTSLSKFSIFACFSIYCFYAKHLFPPYSEHATSNNKSTILAIMRGAEVSIVNILISIPFLEALQQSKGSIARIFLAIERRSQINVASTRGHKLDADTSGFDPKMLPPTPPARNGVARKQTANGNIANNSAWLPSISFRMVHFGYADRCGPTTRRLSTLPCLKLVGPYAGEGELEAANMIRRRSVIEQIADEAIDSPEASSRPVVASTMMEHDGSVVSNNSGGGGSGGGANSVTSEQRRRSSQSQTSSSHSARGRRRSSVIRQILGKEIRESHLGVQVLHSFNLEIKPGQSVALVGPSGSGKSTVLALVQRLYEISDGQLLIGQHDIKDINLAWLRNQIGLVGQEPRLFDMTIAENIMLGLPQEKFDALNKSHDSSEDIGDEAKDKLMQQVIEASKAANAHEFIVRLPNGYRTRVGSGGVQLSGGQKQRIAIARALIREPKILLLDECTSALDTESEARVHAALKQSTKHLKSPRTTLIVAHRLETIKNVDLIVVMNQGQVVACGSHEELMKAAATENNQSNSKSDLIAGAKIYKQLYEEQSQAKQKRRSVDSAGPLKEEEEEEEGGEHDDDGGGSQQQANDCNNHHAGNNLNSSSSKLRTVEFCGKTNASIEEATANVVDDQDQESSTRQLASEVATSGVGKEEISLTQIAGFQSGEAVGDGGNSYKGNVGDVEKDADGQTVVAMDNASEQADDASSFSSAISELTDIWRLWHFMAIPKWSTLAAVLICLLSGLILPLNLIAHSYLFSAFAYKELAQIGECLQLFGLIILSFSTFVFIVSFLQILLPGYVGEKLSVQLRVKTMDSLLQKPMFYFDMDSNSAGAICDRFNSYISNLQSIAGTRVATMLEAVSTLIAGAIFGFGQNFVLSMFCLSFALLVLVTTIIESQIMERESSLQRKYDAQLAHLMADALSNIKTIASLNREQFFVQKFGSILRQREQGIGRTMVCLHTFLTSLKFVMPAMSWSASMYYGSYLLTEDRINLQTIYVVCPVVLFAVNDTFRALVFLPELLKARKSIERLYQMNREFSPEVLQTLTFAEQLAEQNRLHLEQLVAETSYGSPDGDRPFGMDGGKRRASQAVCNSTQPEVDSKDQSPYLSPDLRRPTESKKKRSISFAIEGEQESTTNDLSITPNGDNSLSPQPNRRLSNLKSLPTYMSMRRKSSRLNSLIPRSNARGRIQFNDVEFAYPNRPSALVLDGFTLNIEPGESVALVGASGSGKSTTVAILEKFYDFHGGSIRLDGRDLRLVQPNWVRSQIGLVQQEPNLLSYTIGDNIRYGDHDRFVTMDEVVEAARTANIHDFIMTLPDQYDTELSSSAYSSCQLSGGQRQRIAIARALVQNAPILIFDEATSALDNKSEQVVQDALRKAKRGRTSLTIAHRLATIMDADKIAVIREGKVVELGKHEELLAKPDGLYKMLWSRQVEDGDGMG